MIAAQLTRDAQSRLVAAADIVPMPPLLRVVRTAVILASVLIILTAPSDSSAKSGQPPESSNRLDFRCGSPVLFVHTSGSYPDTLRSRLL